MEKLREREHDFSSKLRQESVIKRLREYISWQRNLETGSATQEPPHFGPISINLDLTLACNFSCPHCVDSIMVNTRGHLKLEDIKKMISVLCSKGLLSVILLGGGEPTLHKEFGKVVHAVKERELQLGIVTNGSRLDKIEEIVGELRKKDWVRISIDAAQKETFEKLHRPRTKVNLEGILEKARKIKEKNPLVSLGYSFVVIWDGIEVNGKALTPNIDEMAASVERGKEYSFDYISFKPCLVRLQDSQKESLLDQVQKEKEREIIERIKENLERAKRVADGQIKILESVNLKAMLNQETERIKKQPRRCHMQFFRTVVTPSGIFHCPAFRGAEKAKIGENEGYLSEERFGSTLKRTTESVQTFDAEEECRVTGCFYNDTNWWLEKFIGSERDIDEIEKVEDDNFFL